MSRSREALVQAWKSCCTVEEDQLAGCRLRPGIHAFLELCRGTHALGVRIPDTVVFGIEDDEVWLSFAGKIKRDTGFSDAAILAAFMDTSDGHAKVAVVRKEAQGGTETQAVSHAELTDLLGRRAGYAPFVVQRLVYPACRSSATRVLWRRSAAPEAWAITNTIPCRVNDDREEAFIVDINSEIFTIDHVNAAAVAELAHQNALIVEHLEKQVRPVCVFDELVVDYARDASGVWHLLQVKGWKLRADARPSSRRVDAKQLVPCHCCYRPSSPAVLQFKLTRKMIQDMIAHQRTRGVEFSWFSRPEHHSKVTTLKGQRPSTSSGSRVSSGLQYENLRVCGVCLDLYKAEMALQKAKLALGRQTGAVQKRTAELASKGGGDCATLHRGGSSLASAAERFPESEQTKLASSSVVQRQITQYRMLLYFHDLRIGPEAKLGKNGCNAMLTCEILGLPFSVDVDFSRLQSSPRVCQIHQMRLAHFFSDKDSYRNYIQDFDTVNLSLWKSMGGRTRRLCEAALKLPKQNSAAREMYIPFKTVSANGKKPGAGNESGFIGIALRISIGLCQIADSAATEIMVRSLSLRRHHKDYEVWVPGDGYVSCAPLASGWMSLCDTDSTRACFATGPTNRKGGRMRKKSATKTKSKRADPFKALSAPKRDFSSASNGSSQREVVSQSVLELHGSHKVRASATHRSHRPRSAGRRGRGNSGRLCGIDLAVERYWCLTMVVDMLGSNPGADSLQLQGSLFGQSFCMNWAEAAEPPHTSLDPEALQGTITTTTANDYRHTYTKIYFFASLIGLRRMASPTLDLHLQQVSLAGSDANASTYDLVTGEATTSACGSTSLSLRPLLLRGHIDPTSVSFAPGGTSSQAQSPLRLNLSLWLDPVSTEETKYALRRKAVIAPHVWAAEALLGNTDSEADSDDLFSESTCDASLNGA